MRAVAFIVDLYGFPTDDTELVFLGAGVDANVYGAESNGRAIVLKHYWDWSGAVEAASLLMSEQLRTGGPVYGNAEVLAVFDAVDDLPEDFAEESDEYLGYLVVQERAHLVHHLDNPAYPKIGGLDSVKLAKGLELAALNFHEPEEVELDSLSQKLQSDLVTGALVFGAEDVDLELLDWSHENVGVVERDGRAQAVIVDTGLWY